VSLLPHDIEAKTGQLKEDSAPHVNKMYEDNGIKYREYRALFYEDH
jgi:hypothetical protein